MLNKSNFSLTNWGYPVHLRYVWEHQNHLPLRGAIPKTTELLYESEEKSGNLQDEHVWSSGAYIDQSVRQSLWWTRLRINEKGGSMDLLHLRLRVAD